MKTLLNRFDMVTSSTQVHDPSSCVLHTLKLMNVFHGRSMQQSITVIKSGTNNGTSKTFGHICGQRSTNVSEGSYVELGGSADGVDVLIQGQLFVNDHPKILYRKCECCSSRHDMICENGPVFFRHPWIVIVGWISAVSADRNSFEWCCLHAGLFPVHCRMSRRDSLRRSKIQYGVHRLSWSLCRSSPTAVWIQATRIESCRSSASADLTSSNPRLFRCTRSI